MQRERGREKERKMFPTDEIDILNQRSLRQRHSKTTREREMQYVRERKECSETYREAEIDRDSERGRERGML